VSHYCSVCAYALVTQQVHKLAMCPTIALTRAVCVCMSACTRVVRADPYMLEPPELAPGEFNADTDEASMSAAFQKHLLKGSQPAVSIDSIGAIMQVQRSLLLLVVVAIV
jgi:hypothetical protein